MFEKCFKMKDFKNMRLFFFGGGGVVKFFNSKDVIFVYS